MPGLNEQAYELAQSKCQVQRTDQVFLIRFTGEVFPEYELYLSKLNFYRQRQWSCLVTGKHGLTYEEAVTSEQKSKAPGGQFPAIYEEPVIRLIHHSTHKLDDLSGRIAAHFRDSFVCGEEVLGTKNGMPTPCRVVAVHEAPAVEGMEASVFDTQYDVQWVADGQLSGESVRMPRTDLFRKKPVVTKPMLKAWIAEVAACENVQGVKGITCIWRANDEYIDKFNLALDLPTEMKQKLKKAEQRKQQQANKASNKAALTKAAEQQAIKDQAAAIAAAAFAQAPQEAEKEAKPAAESTLSVKEQAAAIAAAAFAQAPQEHEQAHEQQEYLDDEEDSIPEQEEEASEPEVKSTKRKRVPVPRPSMGTPANPETLEEVEQRLQPGSVKHAIFQVLKNYGAKGRSVGKIVEEMAKKGLREFSTARNAKSSVASTCAHDTAFARVAPGTFALRAVPGVVEVPPSTPGTKATPVEREEEEPEEPVIKPAPRFAKFDRNNFKCTRCLKMHHPEGSPLALCDTCPRSFHLLCMGLEWEELPEGNWSCPRCAERKGLPTKRLTVDDVKNRQSTGGARTSKAEQEKTDKMLIKSLEREERERKRAEERAEKEAQRQMEKDAKNREREEAKKMARYPIEDSEVAEEELAALLDAQQDVRRAQHSVQSSRRLDERQQEQQQLHLDQAEARLHKLRTLAHGPVIPKALFSDAAATASHIDALAVVEFVATFGKIWEAPMISLPQLQRAVEQPASHPVLGSLYHTLLTCVLLDQINEEGPAKSRARRWARVLDKNSYSWPEVLRRYLLATRAKAGIPQAHLMQADTHLSLLPDNVAAVKGALELANKPWWRLSAPLHLRLLTALCNDTLEGGNMRAELASRVDQIAALHSERHHMQLEERRQEKAAERERKQEERQKRLEQLEKQLQGLEQGVAAADNQPEDKTDGKEKPEGQEAGNNDEPMSEGQDKTGRKASQTPEQKAEDNNGDDDRSDVDHDDDKSDQGSDEDDGRSDKSGNEDEEEETKDGSTPQPEGVDPKSQPGEEDERQRQHKTWQEKDAEYEARIAALPLRTEPIGLDRLHRKYWLLTGDQSALHVQSGEGDVISTIDTPEALDAAMAGCNRKGIRERALLAALKHDLSNLKQQLRNSASEKDAANELADNVNTDADKPTVEHAVDQLKELLEECSPFQHRIPNSISFKALQQQLEGITDATQLSEVVLSIEAAVSHLGSGPRGTDIIVKAALQPEPPTADATVTAADNSQPAIEASPQTAAAADQDDRVNSHASAGPSGRLHDTHQAPDAQESKQQQPTAMHWSETDETGGSMLQTDRQKGQLQSGHVHQQQGSLQQPQGSLQQPEGGLQRPQGSLQQRPGLVQGLTMSDVKQEAADPMQVIELPETASMKPDGDAVVPGQPQADVVFAQPLEELDPSDTEQEKASRPKLALWHSARERAVWMRDMTAAQVSHSAAELAYLAAVLSDKAQPMLQRLSASAAAAAARPPKVPKGVKRDRDTPTPEEAQPPKKLKVKLGGSSATAQPRDDAKAAKDGHDHWMAECADCGEEGDLLCCEAKDCPIAMHMECAGLEKVPRGKWYCPEHAGLAKPSKARPASAKSSVADDSSLEPSSSGQAPPSGGSDPAKADAKAGVGGKTGKRKASSPPEDEAEGIAAKKDGGKGNKGKAANAKSSLDGEDLQKGSSKASKGKTQAVSDSVEGSAPKQGGSKAGKSTTASKESSVEGLLSDKGGDKHSKLDFAAPDATPKASIKAKLPSSGASKAAKARNRDASNSVSAPFRRKAIDRDFSDGPPANGVAKAKQKGKELVRRTASGEASGQAKGKAPEAKISDQKDVAKERPKEEGKASQKGTGIKVKFKRLKKHTD